jgi:hypothetical protein
MQLLLLKAVFNRLRNPDDLVYARPAFPKACLLVVKPLP